MDKKLNGILHKLRNQHNITRPELAQKIGCSRQYIHAVENGKIIPSLERLSNILDVFGMEIRFVDKD